MADFATTVSVNENNIATVTINGGTLPAGTYYFIATINADGTLYDSSAYEETFAVDQDFDETTGTPYVLTPSIPLDPAVTPTAVSATVIFSHKQ